MMSKLEDGGPMFPFTPHPQQKLSDGTWDQSYDPGESGGTIRDYACIHLRVAETGKPWLDAIIEKARADSFAGQAMPHIIKLLEFNGINLTATMIAEWAHEIADAMLAESRKEK